MVSDDVVAMGLLVAMAGLVLWSLELLCLSRAHRFTITDRISLWLLRIGGLLLVSWMLWPSVRVRAQTTQAMVEANSERMNAQADRISAHDSRLQRLEDFRIEAISWGLEVRQIKESQQAQSDWIRGIGLAVFSLVASHLVQLYGKRRGQ